jgi:uncharacterized protein YaaQ
MKLIYAIMRDAASEAIIASLSNKGFEVTRLTSTGGFLRQGNVTLLIGVENNQVSEVMAILKEFKHLKDGIPSKITVLVLDLPYHLKVR